MCCRLTTVNFHLNLALECDVRKRDSFDFQDFRMLEEVVSEVGRSVRCNL